MTRGARFLFEGEQLTVKEIRERVPALTDASIRSHLAAGRNTRQAMLSFDPASVRRANGRKAAHAARWNNRFGYRSSDDS